MYGTPPCIIVGGGLGPALDGPRNILDDGSRRGRGSNLNRRIAVVEVVRVAGRSSLGIGCGAGSLYSLVAGRLEMWQGD